MHAGGVAVAADKWLRSRVRGPPAWQRAVAPPDSSCEIDKERPRNIGSGPALRSVQTGLRDRTTQRSLKLRRRCRCCLTARPFSSLSSSLAGFEEMAKSKNHTAHNQSYKAHKNGIKKPKRHRHTSTKGMDPKFLRNQRYSRKHNKKSGEGEAESE
ncbi:hypothetical protein GUJ93_ZPchr0008g11732 [Zizania palustris]|uniref:60S ribosomal protein L29 n=1 Tax=Zizania palustris TaxID=103762 RepID=A0A8J5RTV9_ZIZPA|nr:hypothetical protein GUJ93_ZPchr0008g11732 [Zizania palustris]